MDIVEISLMEGGGAKRPKNNTGLNKHVSYCLLLEETFFLLIHRAKRPVPGYHSGFYPSLGTTRLHSRPAHTLRRCPSAFSGSFGALDGRCVSTFDCVASLDN